MKKVGIIIAIVVIIVAIVFGMLFVTKFKPLMDAKKEFNEAANVVNSKNQELDSIIGELKGIIDSNEKPLDETLIDTTKELIKTAEQKKIIVVDMPTSIEEIKKKTEELKQPIDYTENINNLTQAKQTLETSIKQYKNFMNPTEEFIISRLANVDEIKYSEALTEENDPNGLLHKPGGYTAVVAFESSNVKQPYLYGDTFIERGNEAGGKIEVYSTEKEAKERDEYLAAFDGSFMSSGSHKAIGTTVIRTANNLTATQQKELEQKIINAMATLE